MNVIEVKKRNEFVGEFKDLLYSFHSDLFRVNFKKCMKNPEFLISF